jgi:hypothetical protein
MLLSGAMDSNVEDFTPNSGAKSDRSRMEQHHAHWGLFERKRRAELDESATRLVLIAGLTRRGRHCGLLCSTYAAFFRIRAFNEKFHFGGKPIVKGSAILAPTLHIQLLGSLPDLFLGWYGHGCSRFSASCATFRV